MLSACILLACCLLANCFLPACPPEASAFLLAACLLRVCLPWHSSLVSSIRDYSPSHSTDVILAWLAALGIHAHPAYKAQLPQAGRCDVLSRSGLSPMPSPVPFQRMPRPTSVCPYFPIRPHAGVWTKSSCVLPAPPLDPSVASSTEVPAGFRWGCMVLRRLWRGPGRRRGL